MTAAASPARLRPGDLIRLECTAMAHRGLGLGRLRGQVIFLFAAVPGEEVTARITKVAQHHAFADTVEVHRAAPERVLPPCPYFGSCGGCQLQHMSYEAQLEAKRSVLLDALRQQGLEALPVPELVPSRTPWRYRWRGEFHVDGPSGRFGFTERSGYRLVPIDDCLIHDESITRCLPRLAGPAARLRPPVKTVELTLGSGGGQLLVEARPEGRASSDLALTPELDPGDPQLTDESVEIEYRGRAFRVFPKAFIQVNQGSLERLYEGVVEWLAEEAPGEHLIDAYGGMGILSLRLCDLGARVTVIESNPVSARLCRLHAEMYAGGQLEVVRGEVEEELPRATAARAVVLDPPRAGLSPRVCGWLSLAGPSTLVYLSCEVSALARDLHALCRLGPYRVEALRLVDMFPQTYHFETAALLRRS